MDSAHPFANPSALLGPAAPIIHSFLTAVAGFAVDVLPLKPVSMGHVLVPTPATPLAARVKSVPTGVVKTLDAHLPVLPDKLVSIINVKQ